MSHAKFLLRPDKARTVVDQRARDVEQASGSALASRIQDAQQAFLAHRGDQLAALRVVAPLRQATPPTCLRADLVIEQPLVHAERAMQPERVVEARAGELAPAVAGAAAVRAPHRTEQRVVR